MAQLEGSLVTIGITAYNAADTIQRAVRSALAQSWRPIEVVVVDDCSDDGTAGVLVALAARYSELRGLRNERNGGVSVARNRILEEAKGEFVAFFDDDDESLPNRVTAQLRRIVDYERDFAKNAPVICHTARRLIYPDGSNRIAPTMGQIEGQAAPAGWEVAERILLGAPLQHGYGACATCSQMGRLAVYRALGGFDPAFRRSEDTDFSIRLAKAGGHFVGIAEPLVVQTMTQTPEKCLSEEYRNTVRLLEKHRDVVVPTGQYGFCRSWIEARQAWLETRRTDFAIKLLSLAFTHPVLTMQRMSSCAPQCAVEPRQPPFFRSCKPMIITSDCTSKYLRNEIASFGHPMVTIGVTCFNAQDTIGRALASALAQDWPNLEVVIVDDASTDGSLRIINAAIACDPRARLVCHSCNKGPGGTRNTILAEANGEFVAFFDDDDEALPNRISAQVRTLASYEMRSGAKLVACYASGERRYPNGYIKSLPAIGSQGDEAPNGPGVADYLLVYRRRPEWFFGTGTPACSLMARRSTFAAVDGFDTTFKRLEDIDFAIRLALRGAHFVGASESLFVQYATDAADKSPEKNLEAEQRLVDKCAAYLHAIGRYWYARRWPMLRYWHFKRNYGRFLLELASLCARHPMSVMGRLFATGPSWLYHERRMRGEGRRCD